MAMARMRARVVCTLWLTIDTLEPVSWLTSVDLPALGAPMMAQKPHRGSGRRFVSSRHGLIPSRFRNVSAASISAARLLLAVPSAGALPLTSTETTNTGSCSGPSRLTIG